MHSSLDWLFLTICLPAQLINGCMAPFTFLSAVACASWSLNACILQYLHFFCCFVLEVSSAWDAIVLPWAWFGLVHLQLLKLLGCFEVIVDEVMVSQIMLRFGLPMHCLVLGHIPFASLDSPHYCWTYYNITCTATKQWDEWSDPSIIPVNRYWHQNDSGSVIM